MTRIAIQGIKREVFLRIKQNLMTLPGQKIEDIKEVRSHYLGEYEAAV